jgi:hypothetical protein
VPRVGVVAGHPGTRPRPRSSSCDSSAQRGLAGRWAEEGGAVARFRTGPTSGPATHIFRPDVQRLRSGCPEFSTWWSEHDIQKSGSPERGLLLSSPRADKPMMPLGSSSSCRRRHEPANCGSPFVYVAWRRDAGSHRSTVTLGEAAAGGQGRVVLIDSSALSSASARVVTDSLPSVSWEAMKLCRARRLRTAGSSPLGALSTPMSHPALRQQVVPLGISRRYGRHDLLHCGGRIRGLWQRDL